MNIHSTGRHMSSDIEAYLESQKGLSQTQRSSNTEAERK